MPAKKQKPLLALVHIPAADAGVKDYVPGAFVPRRSVFEVSASVAKDLIKLRYAREATEAEIAEAVSDGVLDAPA